MFGSVPLKTYLPDGDIDMSIFCPSELQQAYRDTWALRLQSVLEQEQQNRRARYRIGDVTLINAEVGVLGQQCWRGVGPWRRPACQPMRRQRRQPPPTARTLPVHTG